MPPIRHTLALLALSAITLTAAPPALIHYQGRLLDGTNLLNGIVGLQLQIYTNATAGDLVYEDSNSVTVIDGLYDTFLGDDTTVGSLAAALAHGEVWLQVVVDGTALSPRERVASVPYALAIQGLMVTPNQTVVLAPENATNDIPASAQYAVVGGGSGHFLNSFAGNYATISGGRNHDASQYSSIGGGDHNQALNSYAVVAGGRHNVASEFDAAIGGGRNNLASQQYAVVGGGHTNRAVAFAATIAGGERNTVGGQAGSIGGGTDNIAGTGFSERYATVAGGVGNVATGVGSTIGGGSNNVAIGTASVVPGGENNEASGEYSFAAGRRAKTAFNGTFVWGDSTDEDLFASDDNQFLIRAAGGVGINTNAPAADLDVAGSFRLGSAGSVLTNLQAGTVAVGAGSNVAQAEIVFPAAFTSAPRLQVTPRNVEDNDETFVASVRTVTATNAVVNIVRVDAAGGWTQDLQIDWLAWD